MTTPASRAASPAAILAIVLTSYFMILTRITGIRQGDDYMSFASQALFAAGSPTAAEPSSEPSPSSSNG